MVLLFQSNQKRVGQSVSLKIRGSLFVCAIQGGLARYHHSSASNGNLDCKMNRNVLYSCWKIVWLERTLKGRNEQGSQRGGSSTLTPHTSDSLLSDPDP